MTTRLLDNAIAQMLQAPTPNDRTMKLQSRQAIESLDEMDLQWLHALLHLPREYWFIFLRETFEGGMTAAIDFSQGKSGVMVMQAARDFDRLEDMAIERLRERVEFGVLEL